MAIKVYKRTSAGRRNSSVNRSDEITASTPEKSLLKPLKKKGGRNQVKSAKTPLASLRRRQ